MIVDGAAREATTYTLSHWPGTPTPPGLDGDLSAEIVRLARRRPELLPAELAVASIDHYDVDGVVALGLVVLDGLDAEHGPLLVEAARVGDFEVVTDRRAALVAFALNGLEDGAGGSGGPPGAPGSVDPLERCGVLAHEALSLLCDLAADPGRFERLWGAEAAAYDAAVAVLAEGGATVEEIPELDLAVVRLDADDGHGPAAWDTAPLHRAAVHGVTSALRVATIAGRRMELRYRYESWVRLARARPRRRVDLERLARVLTAEEKGSARWLFDGAGSITAALHLVGERTTSTIEPSRFVESICTELQRLDAGPPAWDPYRPGPGLG